MRVLLSAYACEPNKGSEPGVGWNWAVQLSKLQGVELVVLTRSNNQAIIEAYEARHGRFDNVEFMYYDLPEFFLRLKRGPLGVYWYYYLWQMLSAYHLLSSGVAGRIDIAHHLTFGVYRMPTFLWLLRVPLLIGPVGGGESTPLGLLKSLRWRDRLKEIVRTWANTLCKFDPFLMLAYSRARHIVCKTQDTRAALPEFLHSRTSVSLEIGLRPDQIVRHQRLPSPTFRVLYVGRCIYWKGLGLALCALAAAKLRGLNFEFHIVGDGPDRTHFARIANGLSLGEHVVWHGNVSQQELGAFYGNADCFLYPSLHDSSGNVVLEACGRGLPVVCLAVGGPAELIPEGIGIKIDAIGQSTEEVVTSLADALLYLEANRDHLHCLSEKAFAYASGKTWGSIVRSFVSSVYEDPSHS